MMIKRYLPVASIACVLLAACSVAAIADGDSNNSPSADQAQIVTIESEAKQTLEVLREGRSADDALREDLAGRLDRRASFGMNPSLSRLAIGNATYSIYIIPARDHVCVSLVDPVGAGFICPPVDEVAKGKVGPAMGTLETGDVAIYGIVPDGVESVSVQTGSSSSIDVVVHENVYYTVIPAGTPLRAVGYVGPSGPVEFPIYDPARVLRER